MNEVVQIQFADKMLSFDTFLSVIRNVVKEEVCKAVGKRPFLTQAKAYDIYGRKNVERWKREGKVKDFARGRNGKIRTPIEAYKMLSCKLHLHWDNNSLVFVYDFKLVK